MSEFPSAEDLKIKNRFFPEGSSLVATPPPATIISKTNMKLRLRFYKTKETLKVEVPNPCTLQHLKQILSQNLPCSSQSSTIYLSLNQKDNLTTPSPQDSIQSTGITSGDLIYFTTNPNGFSPTPQPMEIDQVNNPGKSFSVPGFLRKVFTEELGDNNHKLLAIAVRAVLVESGFVEIDPISKTIQTTNNFNIQPNLHLASFHFTLPALLTPGPTETVKIKFQTLGTFCNVYGYINNGPVHSVQLNESKLVPFLNMVWANCGQSFETITQNNRIEPEREVFEFWRKTKDAIALPVLIDLCESTGIDLPPCFIQLPSEIKLKILDYVSGADVASVSCVCWELRYLGSSDELWKDKYVAEFGGVGGEVGGFKERFRKAWEGRKRRRVGRSGLSIGRVTTSFGPPYIIGGVHDIWPNVGGPRLRNARLLPDCNFDF